ncbi:acyl-CoA dehydrogenase family protein [Cellulomonas xiejunii]|uniref:acyl-CoA dehydrogenase family protein n=1 Tax=Cellulomonas xiejunii TaxID=2968083 RepID=UPI001D0E3A73|nr:acyl-CoA dehydrogenase family protein [Cellulomonas xiejunii]MCC2314663.1 acyl-CoA dehydrogenase family protein [Cellulomonas xiejunii]
MSAATGLSESASTVPVPTSTLIDRAVAALVDARSDHGDVLTRAAWQGVADAGLVGLTVPSAYGGAGLDPAAAVEVLVAVARDFDDSGWLFGAGAHLLACAMPLALHGSAALKERYLPAMCDGRLAAGNAMTEAAAGSDVAGLSTTATPAGPEYVLTGTKTFVTNGPVADVFVVYAQTDADAGFLGNTAFVVEREVPGVTVGPAHDKVGMESVLACAVTFDGVRVPADRVIGAPGQGNLIFQESMWWERTIMPALLVGRMDAVVRHCTAFARSREQFGRPVVAFQAVSHRLARMEIARRVAEQYVLHAATSLVADSHGRGTTASAAKYAATEAAVAVGEAGMEVLGGAGYLRGNPAEALLRAALGARAYSGTNDVQLEIVARGMGA